MNKIYKCVWSAAKRCWMVVGEWGKNTQNTGLKKISLLVIMALPPGYSDAKNNESPYVGVQSTIAAETVCINAGVLNTAIPPTTVCDSWGAPVLSIAGTQFGYMAARNGTNQGMTWAGSLSAGLTFGGMSRAANTSQVIANAAGLTLNGDAVNLNSNTFTVNSVNGLVMSSKKITSLAAGSAATDAVNVSQLSSVLNGLSGGTGTTNGSIDASTGAVTMPTYSLSGTNYTQLGTALVALDNGTAGPVKVTGSGLTVGASAGTTTVSFAGSAGNRQLIGVANGNVASGSTQAVNGGQLFATSQSIATALGGSATVGANGAITGLSYNLPNTVGTPFTNVGSALSALDTGLGTTNTSLSNLNTTVTNLTNNGTRYFHANSGAAGTDSSATGTDAVAIGTAATAGNDGDVALGANSVTAATVATPSATIAGVTHNFAGNAPVSTVSIGAAGSERTLTNVAAGRLSDSSTDAVNGSQLFASNQAIDTLSTTINNGGIGLVRQSAAGQPITVGAATDGSAVDFTGTAGNRTLTGVAAGALSAASTEAVNGGQLFATNTNVTNLGSTVNNLTTGGTRYFHANSGAAGTDSSATGTDAVAIGAAATAGNDGDVALGANSVTAAAVATPSATIAGVTHNFAGNAPISTVSIGAAGSERTLTNVAAGRLTDTSTDAVNGSQLFASNQAIDTLSTTINNGGIGLVRQSAAGQPITVGAATDGSAVNFAGTGGNRTLTGVAVGSVASGSTEAINGGQLYGTSQSVATALGGGAAVDNSGAVTAPSYNLANTVGGPFTNVGSALSALDSGLGITNTSLTATTNNLTTLQNNIDNGTVGLVQQSAAGEPITVGKDTDGSAVDFAGTAGNRTLTGVAAGALSAASTEAVNGGQLFATNTNVTNLGSTVNNLTTGGTRYFHANSGAAGTDSSATGTDAVAIGAAATAGNAGDVALGANSVTATTVATPSATIAGVTHNFAGNAPVSTVSIGAAGSERTLTNVAAGRLTDTSTDAVNGSQLFASNEAINSLSDSISGGGIGLVQQPDANGLVTVAAYTGGTSVSFAGSNGSRTLIGVAAGEVSETSNQAINGSQLYAANQNVASALGGGSTVDVNGNLVQPGYNIQGSVRNNVGDALSALDTATTSNTSNISNLINNVNTGALGLVRQASSSSVVTVAATSGGTEVAFVGSDGNRRLTGVANGAVTANSSEAVNGSQLFATNQQLEQNTNNINDIYQNINNLGNGLVKQASNEGTVDVASETGGHTVDITGDEGTRTLTGLSDGVSDDDAVTVRQIKALQIEPKNIDQLAVNASGVATASGSNAAAVGSNARSTGVNSTTLGNDTLASGANSTVVGNGAVASGDNSTALGAFSSVTASNSVALGANSVASEANTVSVGAPGNERRITNVASGVNDTDAVNVYQLNQVQAANNQSFRNINKRVDQLDDKLTAGVASAMAMAGLPQAWEPASSLVSVAVGGYEDKAAIAIGVSAISDNGRWITKLQGSGNNESDFGISLGVGYQW